MPGKENQRYDIELVQSEAGVVLQTRSITNENAINDQNMIFDKKPVTSEVMASPLSISSMIRVTLDVPSDVKIAAPYEVDRQGKFIQTNVLQVQSVTCTLVE